MKKILCMSLLAVASGAFAQEPFSTTPKQESLQEAIRFEKYKVTSAEMQDRKDAAEQRASTTPRKSKVTTARTNKSKSDRQTGQADSQKK